MRIKLEPQFVLLFVGCLSTWFDHIKNSVKENQNKESRELCGKYHGGHTVQRAHGHPQLQRTEGQKWSSEAQA